MRLELSSEGRYALRALLYLAWTAERVPAQRISGEAHVPRRLLARILATLSRAGLVESEQGRNGGSRLARPADQITLGEAVEGPLGVTTCNLFPMRVPGFVTRHARAQAPSPSARSRYYVFKR